MRLQKREIFEFHISSSCCEEREKIRNSKFIDVKIFWRVEREFKKRKEKERKKRKENCWRGRWTQLWPFIGSLIGGRLKRPFQSRDQRAPFLTSTCRFAGDFLLSFLFSFVFLVHRVKNNKKKMPLYFCLFSRKPSTLNHSKTLLTKP